MAVKVVRERSVVLPQSANNMKMYLLLAAASFVLAANSPSRAETPALDRPRLLVLTDFFKDPDDKQSLIRLLTYANEFELEGLIATSLAFGTGEVRPDLIKGVIDEYAKVFPNLREHGRSGYEYPAPNSLKSLVKAGAPVVRMWAGRQKGFPVPHPPGARDSRTCDPPEKWIGEGRDTEASEHIIRVADRDDPRPLWIGVWGGAMDLAQALWKVHHTRSPEETAVVFRDRRARGRIRFLVKLGWAYVIAVVILAAVRIYVESN